MSEFITHSREETVALGAQVAQHLAPGALIAFTGGRGAGGRGPACRIVSGRKKGRIELEYYGTDDLNDLLDALHAIKKK